MKRLLFILAFLCSLSAYAQQPLYVVDSESAIKDDKPFPIVDSNTKELLVVNVRTIYMGAIYFNAQGEKLKDFGFPIDEYSGISYAIGGILNKAKALVILSNNKEDELSLANIDLDTKKGKVTPFANFSKIGEIFIGGASAILPDSTPVYNLLTVSKDSKTIYIYTLSIDQGISKQGYDVSTLAFGEQRLADMARKNTLKMHHRIGLEGAIGVLKVYAQKDFMMLTCESGTATHVLRFNTVNKTAPVDVFISMHYQGSVSARKKGNSYVYDSLLFQVCVANDFLHVKVSNCQTRKVINEFLAKAGDEVTFKNTPFKEETTEINDIVYNKIENTKEFLKKCLNMGNIAVLPQFTATNALQIRIGAYQHVMPTNYSYVGPNGNMIVTGSREKPWDRYIYFDMLLDVNSFAHTKGYASKMFTERINNYLNNADKEAQTNAKLLFNNELYFFFFTKGKLNVLKFN